MTFFHQRPSSVFRWVHVCSCVESFELLLTLSSWNLICNKVVTDSRYDEQASESFSSLILWCLLDYSCLMWQWSSVSPENQASWILSLNYVCLAANLSLLGSHYDVNALFVASNFADSFLLLQAWGLSSDKSTSSCLTWFLTENIFNFNLSSDKWVV